MKEMLETFQYIFYSYCYIIHSKSQSNFKVYKALIKLKVDDGVAVYRAKL